jgi:hypothetical protein
VPAPFSPRANALFTVALLVASAVIVGTPVFLILAARTPYVTEQGDPLDQPVFFDHRHHVRDDGIDCRYCHDLVERSPSAGVPPTDRCLGCHSQIWNESPLLEPVWESYRTGRPIPWVRVHDLPDFVYFDHSAHVTKGVGCQTCHGPIDRMARVYQWAPLTMQWCLDCHRNPEPQLRPEAWITSMISAPPREGDWDLPPVSPGLTCSTCHR